MKRTLKDRLMGVVLGILIGATMVTTAVATTGRVQKMLDYTDIKIILDGEEVIPKDANGKYVEPFAIEGTTYLPVRAISNALGLEVGWDQATKTVKLTTPQKEVVSEEGNVIYNENGIKVTFTDYELDTDSVYYFSVYLMIENNSSQKVTLYSDSSAINGIMVDGNMVCEVLPGKKATGRYYFRKNTFDNNNIDVNDIYDIEIQFHYWFINKYIYSEPIKLLKESNTTNTQQYISQSQAFEITKNYLMKNGYKQDRNGNIIYTYNVKVANATIVFNYRQNSNTFLFRYDSDADGINNAFITIYPDSDDIEIAAYIDTDNPLVSYTPSMRCKASDFTSDMTIRFNDNTIHQYNQQAVDEFVTNAIHVLMKTMRTYIGNMDLTLKDFGFVNYT